MNQNEKEGDIPLQPEVRKKGLLHSVVLGCIKWIGWLYRSWSEVKSVNVSVEVEDQAVETSNKAGKQREEKCKQSAKKDGWFDWSSQSCLKFVSAFSNSNAWYIGTFFCFQRSRELLSVNVNEVKNQLPIAKLTPRNLMVCWPCIIVHQYSENQRDVLFIQFY
jgi:hypothetical protein